MSQAINSNIYAVLNHGKNELLPRAQILATVVGWIAVAMYVLAALLGIAGKYVEIKSKKVSTNDEIDLAPERN